jgi:hypothetical protein
MRRVVLPRNSANANRSVFKPGGPQHANETKTFEGREFTGFPPTSELVVTRDSNEWNLRIPKLDEARRYFLEDFGEYINISSRRRRIEHITQQADCFRTFFPTNPNRIAKSGRKVSSSLLRVISASKVGIPDDSDSHLNSITDMQNARAPFSSNPG